MRLVRQARPEPNADSTPWPFEALLTDQAPLHTWGMCADFVASPDSDGGKGDCVTARPWTSYKCQASTTDPARFRPHAPVYFVPLVCSLPCRAPCARRCYSMTISDVQAQRTSQKRECVCV